ncbi:MAG TPA: hypothetical protein VKT73_13120 [Xanthobacteraceae bacterium]|nr:hypothetical protein [Xanthobacteraceae bacterium]
MSQVDDLDSALQEDGEDCILRRLVGKSPTTNNDLPVRANVRSYRLRANLLVNDMAQYDLVAIMSPTEIKNSNGAWPGDGSTAECDLYPRKGDKLIVQGRVRAIDVAELVKTEEGVVRIELMLLG